MRLPILLLLFILVISTCQETNDSNSTSLLLTNKSEQQHTQDFPYIQECPVSEANSTATNTTSFYTYIAYVAYVSPWMYLFYSTMTLGFIQDHYVDDRICFTFTIYQIMGHFHMGLLHLFSSQTILSSIFFKSLFFCIMVIANTNAFFGILLSEKLKTKQYVIIVIYLTILLITLILDKQSYERLQAYLFIFSPIIHIYYLLSKKKKINLENAKIAFSLYYTNAFLLPMFMRFTPQLFSNKFEQQERLFLQHFVLFVSLFYLAFVILPFVQAQWIMVSRRVINKIKMKLGREVEEEVCIICLQKMDSFGDLYHTISVTQSKESDLYEAECGHIFHSKCILLWALTKGTCPLDNQILRI